mgnify:CR=1 FL=1
MDYLSLFSGAGGGDLAGRLLGWRCRGHVEYNGYCQRVLRARQDDGHLDEAPIFGDVGAFISDGYADRYRGMVDCVVAAPPCQGFSSAGKSLAGDDPRNQWPATADVLRRVQPRVLVLENVSGLLSGSHGYFGRILGDLAELGLNARWQVLSAADVGAPHLRKRLWLVAHSDMGRRQEQRESEHRDEQSKPGDESDRPCHGRRWRGPRPEH